MSEKTINVDVCIIGCGSGGTAAAIQSANQGLTVAVIDRSSGPGGHSVFSYVSDWPAGPAENTALSIYNAYRKIDSKKITISKNYQNGGENLIPKVGLWFDADDGSTYDSTLNQYNVKKSDQRMVNFDPDIMRQTMLDKLNQKKCQLFFNTTLTDITTNEDNTIVESVQGINATGELIIITANVFIDSTAGGYLCQLADCEVAIGEDPKSLYNEPDAPSIPKMILNGISYCYKLVKGADTTNFDCSGFVVSNKNFGAFITGIVDGDILVNPLGGAVLDGSTFVPSTEAEIIQLGEAIARCHWNWLKEQFKTVQVKSLGLDNYKFDSYAITPGIRETYRVICDYMLNENDLIEGYKSQTHTDMVAIADHPIDIHGGPYGNEQDGSNLKFPKVKPYGIPYRCMIPKSTRNILIACRGAGFSHIAASSCRLSRTMMALGHVAALGAKMSIDNATTDGKVVLQSIDVRNVNTKSIIDTMQESFGRKWYD